MLKIEAQWEIAWLFYWCVPDCGCRPNGRIQKVKPYARGPGQRVVGTCGALAGVRGSAAVELEFEAKLFQVDAVRSRKRITRTFWPRCWARNMPSKPAGSRPGRAVAEPARNKANRTSRMRLAKG